MSGKTLEQIEKEQKQGAERSVEVDLEQIDSELAKISNFIKVEGGQTIILQFFPKEKISIVQGNYQGQPTTRLHFAVVDPKVPGERKILALSKKHSQQLLLMLKKGFDLIEVTRKGSGKNDTAYMFTPSK